MTAVSVREGYARWAATYDRDPNPLLALEERHLRPLLTPLEGKRVLDLACGTGRWMNWLRAQRVADVVGVDFSAAMLGIASGKPALHKHLVEADCCALPFADRVFDVVICSFALGHVQDIRRVTQEVARVTAAGRDVYVSDLHPCAYEEGWKTAFCDQSGPAEIATWPRPLDVQLAAWRSAGFRCLQSIAAWLDWWELPILAKAGKTDQFEDLSRVPAVQIFHLR